MVTTLSLRSCTNDTSCGCDGTTYLYHPLLHVWHFFPLLQLSFINAACRSEKFPTVAVAPDASGAASCNGNAILRRLSCIVLLVGVVSHADCCAAYTPPKGKPLEVVGNAVCSPGGAGAPPDVGGVPALATPPNLTVLSGVAERAPVVPSGVAERAHIPSV